MEKTFVNALAYSRILKFVIIFVLAFVVIVDILVIALVIKVIGYASSEERTRIVRLLALLHISSAMGFPLFYFLHRSLRNQWIRIGDSGITYNSWSRKVSAAWDEVAGVSVISRGKYGQASRGGVLRIDTKRGGIYALPIFVDKSMPIPQLRFGISSWKLSYPDGRIREVSIKNSDIYMELRNYVPDLFSASLNC